MNKLGPHSSLIIETLYLFAFTYHLSASLYSVLFRYRPRGLLCTFTNISFFSDLRQCDSSLDVAASYKLWRHELVQLHNCDSEGYRMKSGSKIGSHRDVLTQPTFLDPQRHTHEGKLILK
ncbi:hypothetical protein CROQUDRAFT_92883 [Cronartium quercuum f. sp. fusiforme G11]|uniref:Uncharacterized protein n=1 Tax=Cronartium quercuum f. sp. fusiforme G11 TaxID=708437 RepID=A0A9P6NHV5_9BASI|nr:hypothetical protein CROQUDRAFT_92883 [Cronartium quercuum f. sp. fusiforme G11]